MNTEKSIEFFIQQYELVYKDLYRFALYTLKNPHDAEDIVSETVTDAFASFSKLRNLSSFRAWIFRILSNKCKQKLREYVDKTSTLSESLSNDSSNLANDLEIRTAFSSLSKEERLILSMDIFAGYTSREIGKILNLNENTIRSKKSRALKKLKEQLNY
ncbi:MAG: RNA polymerase sigma factor [Lachnospiraceae bacterium]